MPGLNPRRHGDWNHAPEQTHKQETNKCGKAVPKRRLLRGDCPVPLPARCSNGGWRKRCFSLHPRPWVGRFHESPCNSQLKFCKQIFEPCKRRWRKYWETGNGRSGSRHGSTTCFGSTGQASLKSRQISGRGGRRLGFTELSLKITGRNAGPEKS